MSLSHLLAQQSPVRQAVCCYLCPLYRWVNWVPETAQRQAVVLSWLESSLSKMNPSLIHPLSSILFLFSKKINVKHSTALKLLINCTPLSCQMCLIDLFPRQHLSIWQMVRALPIAAGNQWVKHLPGYWHNGSGCLCRYQSVVDCFLTLCFKMKINVTISPKWP